MIKTFIAAGLFAATLTTFAAQDWTEFRGSTGQGISDARNVPLVWSDTNNVAWKVPIPGTGWSSPVLLQGRVYLTTAVEGGSGAESSLRTLCLDAATGQALWSTEVFKVPGGKKHSKNSHASPTPVLEKNRIYVHFGPQGTACLDLKGKVLWRNTSLPYPPVHGNGGSPILVEDLLVFSCDGASDPFIVALDKKDGVVRWKTNRETKAQKKFSFSTPLLITVNGQNQIISPGSGMICALDPKDGKELWRVRYAEGYSVVPRPVFGEGLVFFSTGFDRPIVMAIRPDGHRDVTDTHVAWTLSKGAPTTPSLLLKGGELYMVSDSGIASCVDAKTGAVHWSERVGGGYSASPVFANERVYFQNEEGKAVVVKMGKAFEKLAENSLGERTLASYAMRNGAIFIRTEKSLYRIGEKR